MFKVTLLLGSVLVMLVAESTCQRFTPPIFRPPRQRTPIITRRLREVGELTPIVTKDVPVTTFNREEFLDRSARSLDSHNTREIRLPGHLNPFRPKYPRPSVPAPVPRLPIYARTTRDIQIPGMTKPTHRDVIIPNWNPHVKTNPWNSIGGNRRHGRSIDYTEDVNDAGFDGLPHDRVARDIQINGLPRKPTHRDVIIPNWNPHIKTNPWNSIGGNRRHGRSIDYTEDVNDAGFDGLPHERVARDIQTNGLPRKPTHRDVIIPNWNPHIKTNPWNSIGGNRRHGRSIEFTEDIDEAEDEDLPHERMVRDVQINGLPRKPTHRDVIIPNWNPHIKTNPWNSVGGNRRHGRSIEFTEDIDEAEDEDLPHERMVRDVQINGMPRKPTHRDVIIPNWNPHIKTNPWNSIGGRGRH